jgi:hypothetical protein
MKEYLEPFIVSNIVALALLFVGIKWRRAGRISFAVLFIAAGIFNAYQSTVDAGVYATTYGETALLPFYKSLIYNIFAENAEIYVKLIASFQLFAGICLIFKKPLYCIGIFCGIVFLIGIAPLGLGSAFPSTLLMAVALYIAGREKRK